MVEAFCKPFTAKTGAPVQYQEPYNFAKIRTMHQAKAQQIDATLAITEQVLFVVESKMAAPIDWNVVDRSALSPVQLSFPNLIGFVVQSNLLCYSTKKWPGDNHPNSWADFWDVQKFPGRRALRRTQPTAPRASRRKSKKSRRACRRESSSSRSTIEGIWWIARSTPSKKISSRALCWS